jgi:predicted kinase
MLIAFGGLPGTGKTTLARQLALTIGAVYLRIDTIEQAIRIAIASSADVGELGYRVAYEISKDNLKCGLTVIADSVNPLQITRDAWRAVGKETSTDVVEIEVVCSDAREHRRRVESRVSDIAAMEVPTWEEVLSREYDGWQTDRIIVDTAGRSADESLKELTTRLEPWLQSRCRSSNPP